MGLDIRMPLGLMLALIGAQLAVYGLLTGGADVNLWWGTTLLACGAAFLWWSRAGKRKR